MPFVFIIDSTILLIVNQIYNPGITFILKFIFEFLASKLCLSLAGDFCRLFWGSDPSCLLTHQKACQIQALQYRKKSENCYFLSKSLPVIPVMLKSTTYWSRPLCTRNCVKFVKRTGSQKTLQSKYMRQHSGGYKQGDRKMQRFKKPLLVSMGMTVLPAHLQHKSFKVFAGKLWKAQCIHCINIYGILLPYVMAAWEEAPKGCIEKCNGWPAGGWNQHLIQNEG